MSQTQDSAYFAHETAAIDGLRNRAGTKIGLRTSFRLEHRRALQIGQNVVFFAKCAIAKRKIQTTSRSTPRHHRGSRFCGPRRSSRMASVREASSSEDVPSVARPARSGDRRDARSLRRELVRYCLVGAGVVTGTSRYAVVSQTRPDPSWICYCGVGIGSRRRRKELRSLLPSAGAVPAEGAMPEA